MNHQSGKPVRGMWFEDFVIDSYSATRQLKQADAMIEKEFRLARMDGRVARLVDLSLAKLTIATHENNPTKAMKELGSAISWAARRRIVGPFHDRGSVVASVVMAAGPSMRSLAVSEEKEFFAEICRGLPTNNLLLENWSAIWGSDEGLPVTLTKREVKLLSLLDLGLSNQQVADRSYVSITTIKWHLKNLYRKFGVSTRYAMLARARTLRMISK